VLCFREGGRWEGSLSVRCRKSSSRASRLRQTQATLAMQQGVTPQSVHPQTSHALSRLRRVLAVLTTQRPSNRKKTLPLRFRAHHHSVLALLLPNKILILHLLKSSFEVSLILLRMEANLGTSTNPMPIVGRTDMKPQPHHHQLVLYHGKQHYGHYFRS
jgi:hypothetical protein